MVGRPVLAATGEQADFRVARHDPTWPGMQRDQHAIVLRFAVFLSPEVGAGAQFQSLREGMLVFGASPDDEAHPGGGFRFVAHREGQSVEPDDVRGGGGVDVAVRREGEAESARPSGGGRGWRRGSAARSWPRLSGGLPASTRSKCCRARLSSPLRKKARASSRRGLFTLGLEDQNAPEGRDGRIQQGFPGLVIEAGRARRADTRQSRQQEHFHVVRIGLHQRPQQLERFQVTTIFNQCIGFF